MSTHTTWKHDTTDDILQARAGIDLFDDENPGHVTVYIRYVDGSRAGARDIWLAGPNAERCLAAWCATGVVRDYRAAGQERYLARFRRLALAIEWQYHNNCNDDWYARQVNRLREIADNQPTARLADDCFAILRECLLQHATPARETN